MLDPAVRRERRALFAFGLLGVALILVGVVAAAVLTADEPRRGDGMIPAPTSIPAPDADTGPTDEVDDDLP